MKTNCKFLVAAAVLLGLAACSKVAEEAVPGQQTQENLVPVTLGANFAATKTTMASNGDILWTAGDSIQVVVGDNSYWFTLASGENTTSATFSALVTSGDAAIISGTGEGTVNAYYPKSCFAVPTTQSYVDTSFATKTLPMTATKTSGSTLSFTTDAAVVRVKNVAATATSAELSYTVGSAGYTAEMSNLPTSAAKDLYFVVVPGAQEFNLSIDNAAPVEYLASVATEARKRYNLTALVAQIGDKKYATLAEAIADVPDNTLTTITMIADETFAENATVTVSKNQNIVLDLNGHTISATSDSGNGTDLVTRPYAMLTNYGTLLIKDASTNKGGKMTYTGVKDTNYSNNYQDVIVNSGTLTLESGTLENNTEDGMAVYVVDNNTTSYTAIFNMTGGTLKATYQEDIRLFANNTTADNNVNIQGGTLDGKYGCIFAQEPSSNTNGKLTVNISGGTFVSGTLPAVRLFTSASKSPNAFANSKVDISGGYFNVSPIRFQYYGFTYSGTSSTEYKENITISGGFFADSTYQAKNKDTLESAQSLNNFVVAGKTIGKNTDESTKTAYPYTVVVAPPVAKVGTTEYSDLHEALEAAKEAGKTCELLSNVDLENAAWTPVKDFNGTFDGKGKTISGLTVTGEGDLGLFANTGTSAIIKDLTITGATITSTSGSNHGVLAGSISGSAVTGVTIQNSTVTASAGQYTGGMCGTGYPHVSDCTVKNCEITGHDQVGGMVGYQWVGYIENSTVQDNKVISTGERAGALIGKLQIAAGNTGSSTMWVNGNTIKATLVQAPDMAGGVAGQIMGDMATWSIKNNSIDISSFGTTTTTGVTNPIGVLRADQNAAFTGALATNITGNTWTDATLAADYFVYTNVASGVVAQIISRVGFSRDAEGVYHISDLAGLKVFRDAANSVATNFGSKTIVIDNTVQTIDLNNEEWVPINSSWNPGFTFDGNGCVIKNLKVDKITNPGSGKDPKKYAGLFGSAYCSTIKNLTVDGADVEGIGWVAAIAGHGECAHFINCSVKNATITSQVDNNDDGDKAGAICGYLAAENNASVTGCYAEGCTITAYRDLGSLVGYANGPAVVTGNTAKDCQVICKTDQNYKSYSTKAQFDANQVVGEKSASANVSENTIEDVTVSYVPDFTDVTGNTPSLGVWR